jgi:hypothetical protein
MSAIPRPAKTTLFLIENSLHFSRIGPSLLQKRAVRARVPEGRAASGCRSFPPPQKWRRQTASTPQFHAACSIDRRNLGVHSARFSHTQIRLQHGRQWSASGLNPDGTIRKNHATEATGAAIDPI